MSSGSLAAKWSRIALSTSNVYNRSSHSLAVLGDYAYLFGGEQQPRIPVASDILVIGLKGMSSLAHLRWGPVSVDRSERIIRAPEYGQSVWPAPRVGSAMVAAKGALWLWGGRGGTDMGTFSSDDDLWRFDPSSEKWESLRTAGNKPEQRSFHVLATHGSNLYVHAGCPAKGRLASLHSLNLDTLTWSSLPDAPGPARGGTVLSPISDSLVRFGGFAGYELGGPLDIFDTSTGTWKSLEEVSVKGGVEGPQRRSVHSLVAIDGPRYGSAKVVAVMTHGEREAAPAELGHNGAGYFHSDAWALLEDGAGAYTWALLPQAKSSTEAPEARGWFASTEWCNKVLLQGGLNHKNERLGDAWLLDVVVE